MQARDIMTVDVISVAPEASIHALAELLSRNGISGAPVVNGAGDLIGIVSEGDLLHRAENGTARRTEPRRTRWLDGLASERAQARDYLKSHGRTVDDVMSREVITVTEEAGLDEVADVLDTNRIKRVPVLRDGRLVGIVSRANLVRALAAANTDATPNAAPDAAPNAATDDFTIREALLAELRDRSWAKAWDADIMVRDKVVHIWCSDDRPMEELRALCVAAENTPGVARAELHVVHVTMAPVL